MISLLVVRPYTPCSSTSRTSLISLQHLRLSMKLMGLFQWQILDNTWTAKIRDGARMYFSDKNIKLCQGLGIVISWSNAQIIANGKKPSINATAFVRSDWVVEWPRTISAKMSRRGGSTRKIMLRMSP